MLNSNNLTTALGLIAGIAEILIEFEYIEKRLGGVILALSLLGWGFLTNLPTKAEQKWRGK